jgi:hypothetical protein
MDTPGFSNLFAQKQGKHQTTSPTALVLAGDQKYYIYNII